MGEIVFYFPCNFESGVPVLFANIILSLPKCINTSYVDFENGVMARRLAGHNRAKHIVYKSAEIIEIGGADRTIVFQSIVPYTLPGNLRIHPKTRIIFWNLYPRNLIPVVFPLPFVRDLEDNEFYYRLVSSLVCITKRRMRNMIKDMAAKKALHFMDETNYVYTRRYLRTSVEDPSYLPVPVDVDVLGSNNTISKELRVVWVGRICDFKVWSLVNFISQLEVISEHNFPIEIKLDIIGDGPKMRRLKNKLFDVKHVEVTLMGEVSGEELTKYLQTTPHLCFAMGTSALEAGRLGVPTILADYTYVKMIKPIDFIWLFETNGFSLGKRVTKHQLSHNPQDLSQKLYDLLDRFYEISTKTKEYVVKNHSIRMVSKEFVDKVAESNFTYCDINQKLLKKSPIRRLKERLMNRR